MSESRLMRSRGVSGISDVEFEKELLANLILSTEVCQRFFLVYKNLKYLRSDYVKKIIPWISEYFFSQKKSPKKNIKSIFEVEKEKLKEEEITLIDEMLQSVSDDYGQLDEEDIDAVFFMKRIKSYFQKRGVEDLIHEANNLLDAGRAEDAIKKVSQFKEVAEETSEIYNPLKPERIKNFFIKKENNRLFKFKGAAGDFLGYFEKTWVVSFTAPEKRGKSFTLDACIKEALKNKLKVLKVSLELNDYDNDKRFYQNLTYSPFSDRNLMVFPVFDCLKNQDGSCDSPLREGSIDLLDAEGKKPTFDPDMEYKPCTYCRKNDRENYSVATWFDCQRQVKGLNMRTTLRKARGFITSYGDNYRVRVFPAYSAKASDVEALLDLLDYYEGFKTQVLVIDYLDILDDEAGDSDISRIDARWKKFKRIAAQRGILVITVDQAKASVEGKDNIGVNDWSDSKKKNAHVDVKIAINQTEEEYEEQRIRYGVLLNRHARVSKTKQVIVLQDLDSAQSFLDSEICDLPGEEKEFDKLKKRVSKWKTPPEVGGDRKQSRREKLMARADRKRTKQR